MDANNPSAPEGGFGGVMRLFVVLAVLMLAAVGLLAVFEVIPREQLTSVGIKTGLSLVICAVAAAAIALVSRR